MSTSKGRRLRQILERNLKARKTDEDRAPAGARRVVGRNERRTKEIDRLKNKVAGMKTRSPRQKSTSTFNKGQAQKKQGGKSKSKATKE